MTDNQLRDSVDIIFDDKSVESREEVESEPLIIDFMSLDERPSFHAESSGIKYDKEEDEDMRMRKWKKTKVWKWKKKKRSEEDMEEDGGMELQKKGEEDDDIVELAKSPTPVFIISSDDKNEGFKRKRKEIRRTMTMT